MDFYLTATVLYEIYGYMDWYTLKYYKTAPLYFWDRLYNYFCQDKTFTSLSNNFTISVFAKLTQRELFLNLIYISILGGSVEDVPIILLKNKFFVLSYFRHNKNIPSYISWIAKFLQLDNEMILTAIENNPWTLQYLDSMWKCNREIVLKAIEQDGTLIEFVDAALKADKELGLIACKRDGYQFLDNSLKSDPDIIYEALKANVDVVSHFDDHIENNGTIMLEAGLQSAKQSKIIWAHLGSSLRDNPIFVSKFLRGYDSILNSV